MTTPTEKVKKILQITSEYNKKELSLLLGISRPTLDVRLKSNNWKKLEIQQINLIYSKL